MTNVIDIRSRLEYNAISDRGIADLRWFFGFQKALAEDGLNVANLSTRQRKRLERAYNEAVEKIKAIDAEIYRRMKRNPESFAAY